MRMSLKDRFLHLYNVVSGQRFLHMQGLNKEVPFFVCPFDPRESNAVTQHTKKLVIELKTAGVRVHEINMYTLTIELLKDKGIWEKVLSEESSFLKADFMDLLQSQFDPDDDLIPAIKKRLDSKEYAVLFLTGVGEVFPYIRLHTVLNNLQRVVQNKPTLIFFPGEYTSSPKSAYSLNLFGRFRDNYYRAFNIFEFRP